ncbi:MAG TPA: twin-arginine translocation signal domain-containing protein, partial [Gemmatimonadales bacterium]|nr:twin-arginine translocation signal domain-containing protein [Gemmatimonadales bacterium]
MLGPQARPWPDGEPLVEYLGQNGVSRREFLVFCGQMSAILGLTSAATPQVARALSKQRRPSVVWLQLQECTGCVESVLRTEAPSIGDLLLNVISLDF